MLACLGALGVRALQSVDGETLLGQARESLTGEHKDPERARKLLLEIARDGESALGPASLPYAYVYLGYIEDRAGNRQLAIGWYQKALAVQGGDAGILNVAKVGLDRPITWIRHLDAPGSQAVSAMPPAPTGEVARPAKAYVTDQPPAGITVAGNLSAEERRANFEALWSAIDTSYACFELKSIDWMEVGRRYRERLDQTANTEEFYRLMFQLVNELKDTHSWLQNYRMPALNYGTALSIDLFEGKPFVVAVRPGSDAATAGVKAGWEVQSVDGLTVVEKMEALRPYLHACSSERAYRREAGRSLLAGKSATAATVQLRAPGGAMQTVTLRREAGAANRPPDRAVAFQLTRQHFVHFGRHPSGLGYIRIESFNSHDEVADEFDRALDELRDAPGLILDIRDNQGGFGQPRIVGRLLRDRTLVSISHIKYGPGHNLLHKTEDYLDPAGEWQYTRPVALLINDVTGSASDLFACELRSAGRVVTVGTTTHGNLSGVAVFAVLPCGLVVRISNGFISDARKRPIEGNGNVPDVIVEPSVLDFLSGKDPVLDKAVDLILKRTGKKK